jgi:hypothetical protein
LGRARRSLGPGPHFHFKAAQHRRLRYRRKERLLLSGQAAVVVRPNDEVALPLLTSCEYFVVIGLPIRDENPARLGGPSRHLA